MVKKVFKKILLVGLVLGMSMVTRPAAAPLESSESSGSSESSESSELLVPSLKDLSLKKISIFDIKKSDFDSLPGSLQDDILSKLLVAVEQEEESVKSTEEELLRFATAYDLLWAIQPILDRGNVIWGAENGNCCPGTPYALRRAINEGKTEIVRVLLSQKAAIDVVASYCREALQMYMNRGSSADLISMPIDIYYGQLARVYVEISSRFRNEELSLQCNGNGNSMVTDNALSQILPTLMCDLNEKDIAKLALTCKLFAWYAANERNTRLYCTKKNLFCKFINRRLRQLEDKSHKERKENHEEIVAVLQQALEQ